jgi:putative lipoprotein (rSAM/lipoprotein system)
MKKANQLVRRILRKIYTGLGLTTVALVFQACYGPPQAIGLDALIRGTVKSKATNEPIKGIKVSVKDVYQYEATNKAGEFQLYVPWERSYTVLFEDIDGEENGVYSSKAMPVELEEDTTDLKTILME